MAIIGWRKALARGLALVEDQSDGTGVLMTIAGGAGGDVMGWRRAKALGLGLVQDNGDGTGSLLISSSGGGVTPGSGASGFTEGSVIFADSSGALDEDNANLFWNDTTNRLGVGNNTPQAKAHFGPIRNMTFWDDGADYVFTSDDELRFSMQAAGAAAWPVIRMSAAGGTLASPTAQVDSDMCGEIVMRTFNGDELHTAVQLRGQRRGNGANVGGRFWIATRTQGDVLQDHFRVDDDGTITFFKDGVNTSFQVDGSGRAAINTTVNANHLLQVGGTIAHPSSGTGIRGVAVSYLAPATATATSYSFIGMNRTAAASFTLAAGYIFVADTPSLGASSAITNAAGLRVENQGVAAIVNAYGIWVAAQSGAGTLNHGLRVDAATQGAIWIAGASTPTDVTGAILWGSGKDVQLGRAAANRLGLAAGDEFQAGSKIYPGTDAGALQTAVGITAGSGAPNNANGANGDFYLRSDGTVAGNTVAYHKEAGAWVALVTA